MTVTAGPTPPRVDRQWVLAVLDEFEVRLTRYAERITRNPDLARDVVQYAFLRLCDETEGAVSSVGPWLYAVCRNRAVDLLRREQRMQSLDEHVAERIEERHGSNGRGSVKDLLPDEAAELHDSCDLVRKILATLPEPQQEVVDLWADGFSYKEISRVTERTETNVRVIVHRALKAVREHPWAKELMES
ncbi:MAG: sigma-70 family RNA polymerase sigma factor [Planctomycetia bacterium]|nr:sigma-70 family RNA polymerase sigma factor [Planctomycetia bacterium]